MKYLSELLNKFARGVSRLPVHAHVALALVLLSCAMPAQAAATAAIVLYIVAALYYGGQSDGK